MNASHVWTVLYVILLPKPLGLSTLSCFRYGHGKRKDIRICNASYPNGHPIDGLDGEVLLGPAF